MKYYCPKCKRIGDAYRCGYPRLKRGQKTFKGMCGYEDVRIMVVTDKEARRIAKLAAFPKEEAMTYVKMVLAEREVGK